MATDPGSRRWVELASGLLLFAAGCVEQPARNQIAVAPPPVPPGQARVWFYRPYEPSESLNLARIDMNDRYVGAIENGSAFYRDVPPGRYHIVPESFARDFNQDKNVDLVSGQQLYVKIVSFQNWATAASASRSFQRDMFYAWLIPQEVVQAEIARNRSGI